LLSEKEVTEVDVLDFRQLFQTSFVLDELHFRF